MISTGDNHSEKGTVLEQHADEQAEVSANSTAANNLPGFATRGKEASKNQLSQNKTLLLGSGAVVFALLVFVFTSTHRHTPITALKATGTTGRPPLAAQNGENTDTQKSFFPVTDSGRPPVKDPNNGHIDEQDVQRTATSQTSQAKTSPTPMIPPDATLGSLPPFDNAQGAWQPPEYQPTNNGRDSTNDSPKPDKEADQPSLVFVQKVSTNSKTVDQGSVNVDLGLGLPTGTRLRARLEVAASTAVRTPVIAVVEYNYERNGEIIVPAGAKAFGHIDQADRSGYLSLRFDSLLFPDGASVPIEAEATDTSLRPLKGRVEGKNTGKNALVRSLSGIGQVGTLFAGRGGSLSQPFSESDLLRERVASNIGDTADQEVTRLAQAEHLVVSISANTPIYVVLAHGTKLDINRAQSPASLTPATQNLESLRQLLQLQKELSQSSETTPHP
jgi:hypothetical protein